MRCGSKTETVTRTQSKSKSVTYFEMWFQMKGHMLGMGWVEVGGRSGAPLAPGSLGKPGKGKGEGGVGAEPSISIFESASWSTPFMDVG